MNDPAMKPTIYDKARRAYIIAAGLYHGRPIQFPPDAGLREWLACQADALRYGSAKSAAARVIKIAQKLKQEES